MLEMVWERRTLLDCWWECKLVQPLWKTIWWSLKKLKVQLPYDSAILLLGIYLEKTMTWKDTPMVTAALYTIAKTWRHPKSSSTAEWIKMLYTYTMEYYSAKKKNEIMASAAKWMDLEFILLWKTYVYRRGQVAWEGWSGDLGWKCSKIRLW